MAEKELSEALKMAMGGMAYEKQRPAAAKAALSTQKLRRRKTPHRTKSVPRNRLVN